MANTEEKQASNQSVSSIPESTTAKVPTAGNSGGASAEFEPPLACVRRILKNTLPLSTNVGKDASSAFSRACGIFVIYLTACANDFARESKRQTITATDVMAAIKELDFDEFTPQLTKFLESHRIQEKIKRDLKKTNEASAKKKRIDMEASDNEDDQSQNNDELPSKKLKLDESIDHGNKLDESMEIEASVKATEDNEKDDGYESASNDEKSDS